MLWKKKTCVCAWGFEINVSALLCLWNASDFISLLWMIMIMLCPATSNSELVWLPKEVKYACLKHFPNALLVVSNIETGVPHLSDLASKAWDYPTKSARFLARKKVIVIAKDGAVTGKIDYQWLCAYTLIWNTWGHWLELEYNEY